MIDFKSFFVETKESPFAVFGVYVNPEGMVAATTRPEDKNVSIALPGGKVDPGESAVYALEREMREEGWSAVVTDTLIHSQLVDGNLVHWYEVTSAAPLDEYKEKYRGIVPIFATKDDILTSGYGNENLKEYLTLK